MPFKVSRYHDISCGHRVVGHEGKCRHLHGHNYRIHFNCQAENETNALDDVGRVLDFSELKRKLCFWLEEIWDHKFLIWEKDPIFRQIAESCSIELIPGEFIDSLVWVPFNPTAENMARYLVEVIGPIQLKGTGIKLVSVTIEETAKCHASYEL